MSTMLDLTKNRYSSQWRAENSGSTQMYREMITAYQSGTKEGESKAKKLAEQIVREGGMTDKSKQKDVDHILGK